MQGGFAEAPRRTAVSVQLFLTGLFCVVVLCFFFGCCFHLHVFSFFGGGGGVGGRWEQKKGSNIGLKKSANAFYKSGFREGTPVMC